MLKNVTVLLLSIGLLGLGVAQYFQHATLDLQRQRMDLLQDRLEAQRTLLATQTKVNAIQTEVNKVSTTLHNTAKDAIDALQQQCRKQGL